MGEGMMGLDLRMGDDVVVSSLIDPCIRILDIPNALRWHWDVSRPGFDPYGGLVLNVSAVPVGSECCAEGLSETTRPWD
jgi:hypothetical protein